MKNNFLPISIEDMKERGWEEYDFLYVIGDAYVDHPSFGPAIISRVLESKGYKVAIIAQPNWNSKTDFMKLGRPKLGVLVTAGNIDSMVNHYTAAKRPRSNDFYSPGGKAGCRPNRATIAYCNRIREAFGDIPLIIGGIEASLRRFAHYDYWDNKVRRSILLDSRADLLLYGMGEHQIVELADKLAEGIAIREIQDITGSCFLTNTLAGLDVIECPSFEEVKEDKRLYAKSCRIHYQEQDPIRGRNIAQKHFDKYLVQNKPSMPLTRSELDTVYGLTFERNYHPIYEKDGGVPAITEVKYSVSSSRGCFGACNFCALTFHQGRIVQSRSHESIIEEVRKMVWEPEFKGYIHDVGGPTANFRSPSCKKQLEVGTCKKRECLFPKPCPHLEVSHEEYADLLRKLQKIENVKKVFIRSGIRFDYLMLDKDKTFFNQLCEHHVSGQLKVAPEHISPNVLKHMGKCPVEVYNDFHDDFYSTCKKLGKEQYLVPYLMSSHPGSTLKDAIALACYLHEHKLNPKQVQDFYPTPGTISTCMFYTELDPLTMDPVYVAKSDIDKNMQRALLQFKVPENRNMVEKALKYAFREDLIGYGPECLIKPYTKKSTFGHDGYRPKPKDTSTRKIVKKPNIKNDSSTPTSKVASTGGASSSNYNPKNIGYKGTSANSASVNSATANTKGSWDKNTHNKASSGTNAAIKGAGTRNTSANSKSGSDTWAKKGDNRNMTLNNTGDKKVETKAPTFTANKPAIGKFGTNKSNNTQFGGMKNGNTAGRQSSGTKNQGRPQKRG